MSDFDYKSNSYKSKEAKQESNVPEKRAEKVISGTVNVMKKNEIHKIAGVFVPENLRDVGNYILVDVIVPGVKRAISDIVDAILFGSGGRSKRTSNADYVSYDRFSRRDDGRSRFNESRQVRYSYNDIGFNSRGEAEKVLSCMNGIMREYGLVRVADLYDLVGISGSYTDHDYGWTSIRNADVIRDRNEYKIRLPRATPLD